MTLHEPGPDFVVALLPRLDPSALRLRSGGILFSLLIALAAALVALPRWALRGGPSLSPALCAGLSGALLLLALIAAGRARARAKRVERVLAAALAPVAA